MGSNASLFLSPWAAWGKVPKGLIPLGLLFYSIKWK